MVGLNRRCRVGAVAPADAGRGRVCRKPHPRLDRLPHGVLHRGGIHHGREVGVRHAATSLASRRSNTSLYFRETLSVNCKLFLKWLHPAKAYRRKHSMVIPTLEMLARMGTGLVLGAA